MGSWESREAENLVAAIAKHRRDNLEWPAVDALLAAVQNSAEDAASADATGAPELAQQREQLCAICRSAMLYDCDVAKGWSDNCTFVFANTTEFGSL